jgi:hypothetical protein
MDFDRFINLRQRVARRVTRPGKLSLRVKDGDVSLRPGLNFYDLGEPSVRLAFIADQKGGKLRGPRHYCRQSDGSEIWRKPT